MFVGFFYVPFVLLILKMLCDNFFEETYLVLTVGQIIKKLTNLTKIESGTETMKNVFRQKNIKET